MSLATLGSLKARLLYTPDGGESFDMPRHSLP